MMRPTLRRVAAMLVLAAFIGPLRAEVGAVDHVPAATLLIPYFEVDLADPQRRTTIIEYRSVTPAALMTRVTLWTDYGFRTLSYTAYLTGYDVLNFNIGATLTDGSLPVTASVGQDPDDLISPQGPFSEDIDVPSCQPFYPYTNPELDQDFIAYLQAAHTGNEWQLNQCFGFDHGDRIARGYVTIDVVNVCGFTVPGTFGYFTNGGTGEARNDNVLTGTWTLLDPSVGEVRGHAAALEADSTSMATTTPGSYTFYSSQVGLLASDNREALASSWAVDVQAAETELIVWRDQKFFKDPGVGFACDDPVGPTPFPLGQDLVLTLDRDEGVTELPMASLPFPLTTQRLRVGSEDFPAPAKPGWLLLNLATTVGVATDPGMQSHVTVLQFPENADGLGTGSPAISLDSAAAPLDINPFLQAPMVERR